MRAPRRGLTFIFLTNSGDPSHAARLQSAEVLRSPFGLAFVQAMLTGPAPPPAIDYDGDLGSLRRTIAARAAQGDALVYETLFTEALARNYLRSAFRLSTNRPEELTRLLYALHPQAFDKPDIPLMVLLSRLDAPDLAPAAARLIAAFDKANETRPEALYFIGQYQDRAGRPDLAAEAYRRLADEPGFVDEGAKIDACARVGRYYRQHGQEALGRDYLWRSLRYAKAAGYSADFLAGLMRELGAPAR